MQPVISLLLPSRGRAPLVERLFASIIATTQNLNNIEIILYLDEDDIDSHYLACDKIAINKIIGRENSMGAYNSACLQQARGDIIVLINDDLVMKTKGWDEKIIEVDNKFSDKIYLAFANDLFKKNWCSFPILSRKTCAALINPYPIEYKGAFIDTHLYDVFKRLEKKKFNRICYLEDVVFEHLHYRAGKAAFDDTYKKRGRFVDDKAFIDLSRQRQNSVLKLVGIIQGSKLSQSQAVHVAAQYNPKSIYSSLKYLTKYFLCNRNLPFRWRFFLWYWFLGRYLAASGYLWPIVKA